MRRSVPVVLGGLFLCLSSAACRVAAEPAAPEPGDLIARLVLIRGNSVSGDAASRNLFGRGGRLFCFTRRIIAFFHGLTEQRGGLLQD